MRIKEKIVNKTAGYFLQVRATTMEWISVDLNVYKIVADFDGVLAGGYQYWRTLSKALPVLDLIRKKHKNKSFRIEELE